MAYVARRARVWCGNVRCGGRENEKFKVTFEKKYVYVLEPTEDFGVGTLWPSTFQMNYLVNHPKNSDTELKSVTSVCVQPAKKTTTTDQGKLWKDFSHRLKREKGLTNFNNSKMFLLISNSNRMNMLYLNILSHS